MNNFLRKPLDKTTFLEYIITSKREKINKQKKMKTYNNTPTYILRNQKAPFQAWECIKLMASLFAFVGGVLLAVGLWLCLAGQGWENYFNSLMN